MWNTNLVYEYIYTYVDRKQGKTETTKIIKKRAHQSQIFTKYGVGISSARLTWHGRNFETKCESWRIVQFTIFWVIVARCLEKDENKYTNYTSIHILV